ncbi:hypothetical protein [Comamonas testosteroni]|jgi:hypothetical protein|uniref:hypothetical protein n=1 Tax=Comamonas testosteroni TaxID=285 RepID=UPI0026EAB159|nr:hypothetical protein [Comamonas testosteroni]
MKIKITKTNYNFTTLIGWTGVVLGLIGAAVQYFQPSWPGFIFLAVGLVGGAITITFSGPLKTVTEHLVDATPVVPDNEK